MTITVDDEGDLARLDELAARLEDMTPATRAVADELLLFVDARWTTRTSPDGQPWALLKGPSKDRGVMQTSVFARGEATGVVYGASAHWAVHHQRGATHMPARAFLPMPEHTSGPAAELRTRIARIIARHVALNEPVEDDPGDGFGDFNF